MFCGDRPFATCFVDNDAPLNGPVVIRVLEAPDAFPLLTEDVVCFVLGFVQDLVGETLRTDGDRDARSVILVSKEATEERGELGGSEVKADGGHEVG